MIESYKKRVEILKRALTDTIYNEAIREVFFNGSLSVEQEDIILASGIDNSDIKDGYVNPERAETMIGMPRLNNFQECVENAIKNNIEGDIIETGVFRGGACILAAFVIKELNSDKKIYVADSFDGLPKPDSDYPADANDPHHTIEFLKVDIEKVKGNFEKYKLLNDSVCFIKGFFKESLKKVPFKRLSVLRLDGDMYSSTYEALTSLYSKVSIGGYIIVDDYYLPACKQAITDFRTEKNITDTIERIDWTGVYWVKTK